MGCGLGSGLGLRKWAVAWEPGWGLGSELRQVTGLGLGTVLGNRAGAWETGWGWGWRTGLGLENQEG